MSFGRKSTAVAKPVQRTGGLGRAPSARSGIGASAKIEEPQLSAQEIADRREAFIASERARLAHQGLAPAKPLNADAPAEDGTSPMDDPLINLRNMHPTERPAPRASQERDAQPARPLDSGPVGANGLTAAQEAEIRAAVRGTARKGSQRGAVPSGSDRNGGKKYMFGDPAKRSLLMAYLIWFVLGQTGLHRAYCGNVESAFFQGGLLIGSVIILLIFPPLGVVGFLGWMLWIFADLFLMPGMMRRFKAAHSSDQGVFQ